MRGGDHAGGQAVHMPLCMPGRRAENPLYTEREKSRAAPLPRSGACSTHYFITCAHLLSALSRAAKRRIRVHNNKSFTPRPHELVAVLISR